MGLFGSTKIYVSSTVRNLAGEEVNRPNYLKNTVISNIITGINQSTGDLLNNAYLKGPGVKLKNFFKWAEANYDLIGVPEATLGYDFGIDGTVVAGEIPVGVGQTTVVQTLEIGQAYFGYWAEQWMMVNHPTLLGTDWTSDYDEVTGDILITFADTTTASFTPTDFDKDGLYIYASYSKVTPTETMGLVTGDIEILGSGDPFPDTTGWTVNSSSSVTTTVGMSDTTVVDVTWSDSTPGSSTTTTSSHSDSYEEYAGEFVEVVYGGIGTGDYTFDTVRTMYQTQTAYVASSTTSSTVVDDMGGGVTRTTVTTVTTESLVLDKSYRIDEQERRYSAYDGPYLFIYLVGSGNVVLDAQLTGDTDDGKQYFPFIPIRLDNTFLSPTYENDAYLLAKKAFKKSVGGKFDKLVTDIGASSSLPDIDYCYAAFGVPINVIENASKKYLYDFFKKLETLQGNDSADYILWQVKIQNYNDMKAAWLVWRDAQAVPSDPLYGTTEPTIPAYPSKPQTSIRIKGSGTLPSNFDMEISWQSIDEVVGTGLADPAKKAGDLWFVTGTTDAYDNVIYQRGFTGSYDNKTDNVRLYHQVDAGNWTALNLTGFVHKNFVYKGKFVKITMAEALADPEDSGFLVPLHYPTYRTMSIVDYTQMSTACCYLVFNSYLVKKTGFFGSLFFKIFLIVVIIVVVVFAPELAPGLVNAAAATGAALGLSGTIALIAGVIVNSLAAMIITSVMMRAAVLVFGEKFGAIFGAIASFVAMTVGAGLMNGQSLSAIWSSMASAANLLLLANAVGSGMQGYIQASIEDIQTKMEKFFTEMDRKLLEVKQAYAENLGYGNGLIDPMGLTDSPFGNYTENPTQFFARTLLTGSDIADISIGMINDFASLTVSTVLPGT